MNPFRASALRAAVLEVPTLNPISPVLPGATRQPTPKDPPFRRVRPTTMRPLGTLPLGALPSSSGGATARPLTAFPPSGCSPLWDTTLGVQKPSMRAALTPRAVRYEPPPPYEWAHDLLPRRGLGATAQLTGASRPITAEERNLPEWSPRELSARAVRRPALDPIHGVPFRDVPSFTSSWQTSSTAFGSALNFSLPRRSPR